jgi:hypothetical protein
MPVRIPEVLSAKCLTLFVLLAANPAKYRSNRLKAVRFIAATAFQSSGNFHSQPKDTLFGACFFYAFPAKCLFQTGQDGWEEGSLRQVIYSYSEVPFYIKETGQAN